jgi:hypothetical protein
MTIGCVPHRISGGIGNVTEQQQQQEVMLLIDGDKQCEIIFTAHA